VGWWVREVTSPKCRWRRRGGQRQQPAGGVGILRLGVRRRGLAVTDAALGVPERLAGIGRPPAQPTRDGVRQALRRSRVKPRRAVRNPASIAADASSTTGSCGWPSRTTSRFRPGIARPTAATVQAGSLVAASCKMCRQTASRAAEPVAGSSSITRNSPPRSDAEAGRDRSRRRPRTAGTAARP
jgi:hypothetical protein